MRLIVYLSTITIGLLLSANACFGLLSDTWAEWPVNLWCWGVVVFLFRHAPRKERIEIITVIAIATPLELFFSEVWLIYEYQRGLMPLFVPVGHYFLFDTGRILARHIPTKWAPWTLAPLGPLVLYGIWTGTDTSAIVMLILVLGFIRWGPQPALYAAMVWAALAMELWGTYLTNWTWARQVPWTPFTAWNPPLLVGAFYCFGDLLVNLTVARFCPDTSPREGAETALPD